jgi:hypothetical protein
MGRETGGINILPRSIFKDLWRRTIQGPVSDFVVVELQGDPVFGLAFSLREVEVGDFDHEESVCVGLLGSLGSLGVGGWGLAWASK